MSAVSPFSLREGGGHVRDARHYNSGALHGSHRSRCLNQRPVEDALHRNSLRRDGERVSEASIRSVAAQFEPPTASEGFVDVLASLGRKPC
jgi:hypothetical protein